MIINIPSFIWQALLAGVGVALLAGPLGAFMIWQRLSYFGDTLAHASLLGISLSLAFYWNMHFGILVVVFALALAMLFLQKKTWLASDTALGILSHASLAFGLVTLSLVQRPSADILGYLYGDILTVSRTELGMIYGGGLAILGGMAYIYKPLLSITVQPELAHVEGIPVERIRLIYLFLLALVIALSIKIVGVLLMSALLIIPAATARRFSKTPEQLIMSASLLGVLSVILGLGLSLYIDVPTGPIIVCMSSVFFIVCLLI